MSTNTSYASNYWRNCWSLDGPSTPRASSQSSLYLEDQSEKAAFPHPNYNANPQPVETYDYWGVRDVEFPPTEIRKKTCLSSSEAANAIFQEVLLSVGQLQEEFNKLPLKILSHKGVYINNRSLDLLKTVRKIKLAIGKESKKNSEQTKAFKYGLSEAATIQRSIEKLEKQCDDYINGFVTAFEV